MANFESVIVEKMNDLVLRQTQIKQTLRLIISAIVIRAPLLRSLSDELHHPFGQGKSEARAATGLGIITLVESDPAPYDVQPL